MSFRGVRLWQATWESVLIIKIATLIARNDKNRFKMIKITFLGTPTFVQPIKDVLARHFTQIRMLTSGIIQVPLGKMWVS